MPEIIKEKCEDAWKESIKLIMRKGKDYNDGSRDFRQILNFNLEIKQPHEDVEFPWKKLKDCNKWVYPDAQEMRNIILAKKMNPGYSFTYGQRLFHFNEQIDQINDYIIPLLQKDSATRTGVVTLWNPVVDCANVKNPKPGLVMCTFKIVENHMRVTCVIRNNDMFIGWPATLFQINELQEYVSEKLNVKKGSLIFYSTTAHVYKENFEDVKSLLDINPPS